MIYLLDTTAFSALMRHEARVRERVHGLDVADQAMICTITRGEVLYGLDRLSPGKRRSALEGEAWRCFAQLPCLSVDEVAGDQYAHIKTATIRQGTPLADNDLWIAAMAIHLNATLVTMDSDFQRVANLKIEDWSH